MTERVTESNPQCHAWAFRTRSSGAACKETSSCAPNQLPSWRRCGGQRSRCDTELKSVSNKKKILGEVQAHCGVYIWGRRRATWNGRVLVRPWMLYYVSGACVFRVPDLVTRRGGTNAAVAPSAPYQIGNGDRSTRALWSAGQVTAAWCRQEQLPSGTIGIRSFVTLAVAEGRGRLQLQAYHSSLVLATAPRREDTRARARALTWRESCGQGETRPNASRSSRGPIATGWGRAAACEGNGHGGNGCFAYGLTLAAYAPTHHTAEWPQHSALSSRRQHRDYSVAKNPACPLVQVSRISIPSMFRRSVERA